MGFAPGRADLSETTACLPEPAILVRAAQGGETGCLRESVRQGGKGFNVDGDQKGVLWVKRD